MKHLFNDIAAASKRALDQHLDADITPRCAIALAFIDGVPRVIFSTQVVSGLIPISYGDQLRKIVETAVNDPKPQYSIAKCVALQLLDAVVGLRDESDELRRFSRELANLSATGLLVMLQKQSE